MLPGMTGCSRIAAMRKRLDRHIEHQPHPRRIGLGELPRLGVGEIAVGLGDDLEHRGDIEMDLEGAHVPARFADAARRRAPAAPDRPARGAVADGSGTRRRSSSRSSSASAARDCRDRWRGRRSCARRSPRANSCRPARTALRAGRNSAPDRGRRPRPAPSGATTLPTDFDIFSPRLNRKPCTTTCFGTGSPADIRNAGQ